MKNCPCGSTKEFSQCCEPIITKDRDPETAEELMRSRYSAFTLANTDYLMFSHHRTTRNPRERKAIKAWAQSVQWMGLTIIDTVDGTASDNSGIVEFRALFMEDGKMQQIHERSRFSKEKGVWKYVAGEHY
ncbi:Sec-C motif domain protein [Puteibacter caeruleilacunae]|nr:Sec-C motif domain protein [Puteibacter caeruleilacunae]